MRRWSMTSFNASVEIAWTNWREEKVDGRNSSGGCNRDTTIFGDITSGETCKEPVLEDNKSQFDSPLPILSTNGLPS